MSTLALPERFIRIQEELYGEQGRDWLANLPNLIDECAQRWSLQVQPAFGELSYNYVAPATRADGAAVVLKLGVPNKELSSEIAALRLYGGRSICQLVADDAERGALVIERLQPGVMLATLTDDEAATRIAAEVMRQLWRPAPADHPFPTTAQWAKGLDRLRIEFGGGAGPFPPKLVEQAESLYSELLASAGEPVLLHGDLHHFNILSAERAPWLAIDPKGVVGEPAYEIGAFLRNPDLAQYTPGELKMLQARRVDLFSAALNLDRKRILGWAMAQAVLSAWWSYEDHGHGWEPAIQLAELFASLAG